MNADEAFEGTIVDPVPVGGTPHVITMRGSWQLVDRERLARSFGQIPPSCDVIVDVREVTYCDSTILTEFIRLHKRVSAAGRRVDFLLGESAIRRVFQMTHLDKLLAGRDPTTQRASRKL